VPPRSRATKAWYVWRTLDELSTCRGNAAHEQIKKNTAPHELKPSDILIERFTAWKQIVKMLIGMLAPVFTAHTNPSLLRGRCRYRGQHLQGAHQARSCHPSPFPTWKPVPR